METKYNQKLPFTQTQDQIQLWHKFRPVNLPMATDTYKRTMSGSGSVFPNNFTCYSLAARRALKENGVNGRWIMAGLEKALYPWFLFPTTEKEVEKAKDFCEKKASVKKFSYEAWQKTLENNGFLPIDIWGLPGGQTFLAKDGKHVPMMSVEGMGALVTHIEPQLENMYSPIIQATKARLMQEAAGNKFAEFGLRGDENPNNHISLMAALYVGGGIGLTSDDQAVLLFPDYFKDIGTVGHEFIMAYQRQGLSLEQAQKQAMEDFVLANQKSAILPDVINTLYSGLPEIMSLIKKYPDKMIMPRFDSGNVPEQCVYWKKMLLKENIPKEKHLMVVEDGYTPEKVKATKELYEKAGFNPNELIFGAGGYFRKGCHRDAASLVFKRAATIHDGTLEASLKFSDTPGKGSIPGQIRIYEKDNALIVAQNNEDIEGKIVSVPLVKNGSIVYNEDWKTQNKRANETWDKYDTVIYSKETQKIIDKRTKERDAVLERMVEVAA